MKEYVLGFLFNTDQTRLVLIRKNRPEWQAGRLNGIGGKIESHESPIGAMKREFEEETGVKISWWREFCELSGELPENDSEDYFNVHCFVAFEKDSVLDEIKQVTDEVIVIVSTDFFDDYNIIPNLRWLIPMALDENNIFAEAEENKNYYINSLRDESDDE